MPRPRLPHRKRNHHSRILSTFAERLVNACNQKSNRDPVMNLDEAAVRGLAFSGWTISSPLRHAADSRVTSTSTGSRKPSTSIVTRSPSSASCCCAAADSRRTSHPRRAHASFCRPGRRAIRHPAPDEARAPLVKVLPGSPAPRSPLRSSFVRRRRGVGCKSVAEPQLPPASADGERIAHLERKSPHFATTLPTFKRNCGPETRIRPVQKAFE